MGPGYDGGAKVVGDDGTARTTPAVDGVLPPTFRVKTVPDNRGLVRGADIYRSRIDMGPTL